MLKKYIIYLVICLSSFVSVAQNTATHNAQDRSFFDGTELYDKQKYVAARELFRQFIQDNRNDEKAIEAEYYIALCALNLFNNDAESLFSQFVEKYPNHVKAGRAGYDLGCFFYNNKKYDKAIEYFDQADVNLLTPDETNELYFKSGYSYFTKKDFPNAIDRFNKCKGARHQYTYAANYYAGYIEFKNGEYEVALADLNKASENAEYKKIVPILIANIYYRQGKYDELIPYAEGVLKDKSAGPNTSDIKLILGDAYFFKQDFVKSTPLFKEYLAATGNKNLNPDMRYRMGFSSYKSEDYKQAVDVLLPISSDKDSLGQSSAYILGLSYLKSNNKPSAMIALDMAQRSFFNAPIAEEALFLIGKIAVDLGSFTDATVKLKLFLDKYPKSNHHQEAAELLSESFLGSRNYDEALTYIDNLKYHNSRINTAYQRIAYYKAVELINKNDFADALTMLDKSVRYSFDKNIYANAYFWKGECYSIEKHYHEALDAYNIASQQISSLQNANVIKAHYGAGYACYYLSRWSQSIQQFLTFLTLDAERKGKGDIYYRDAVLRLADLYYVTRRFPEAMRYYDLALEERKEDVDYILFQKATISYLTFKTAQAYAYYENLIRSFPYSPYYDNALMQRSQLDKEASKYEAAINGYTLIINKKEDIKGLKPLALQQRAICYFNLKQYDKALADNNVILTEYPTGSEAYSALLSTQEILTIQEKDEEFVPILAKYKDANPDGQNLKDVEFKSALSLYSVQKYSQAVESFTKFIQKYPESPNKEEAENYIGDSYYRLKKYPEALGMYKEILSKQNQYYKKAIQRTAEISFLQSDYQSSITNYTELQRLASSNKERTASWLGLMNAYFELKQLDSSNIYADKILSHGTAAPDAENKAHLYKGKIAYQKEDLDAAQDYFLSCLNGAKDVSAAEAQYMLAKIQYDKKQYKQSLETLYDFNNSFYSYETWLGKSYLLIAENLAATNDMFQAKETLKSIIQKSPNADIKKQAQIRLDQLNALDTKNTTIQEGNGNE
jgi:tetratricopeptide (TPR) repeat protein